jgi:hypothetical protein
MKIILFVFLTIILTGCYYDRGINVPYPESNTHNKFSNASSQQYVPGEIIFWMKDSVSFEQFADTIYSLNNISIDNVTGLQYTSDLSHDSAQTIDSVLKSKSFIYNIKVTASTLGNSNNILVDFGISNFNQNNLIDWNTLIARFKLLHSPSNSQIGLLTVPIGQEKKWINNLLRTDLFIGLELEVINHTSFH